MGTWFSDDLTAGTPVPPVPPPNFAALSFPTGLYVSANYYDPGQPPPTDRPVYWIGADLTGHIESRLIDASVGDDWYIVWTMPHPAIGFAINIGNYGGPGARVEVFAPGGWFEADWSIPGFYGDGDPNHMGPFYGIVSDSFFSLVRLRAVGVDQQETLELWGPAQFGVPEPQPLLIVGTGLVLLALRRRRYMS